MSGLTGPSANNRSKQGYTGPGTGLVLVFDLDNTIIDTDLELMNAVIDISTPLVEREALIDAALNKKLLDEVLRPAAKLRDDGTNKVNAILLLTNNSSEEYVSLVSSYIAKILKSEGAFESVRANRVKGSPGIPASLHGLFFDYIMVRQHPNRSQIPVAESTGPIPAKRIADIRQMLNYLGMPINDLERRTFFFDDSLNPHELLRELSGKGYPGHYVFIRQNEGSESGYAKGSPDVTDYSGVIKAFTEGVPFVRQSLAPIQLQTPPLQPIKLYIAPTTQREIAPEEKKDNEDADLRRHQEFVAASKKASAAPRPSVKTLFSNLSLSKSKTYKYRPMNGESPTAFESRMRKMGQNAYKVGGGLGFGGGKRYNRISRKILYKLKKKNKTCGMKTRRLKRRY